MEEKGNRGYMQTKFTTKKEVESINHHLINKMSILLTELYFRGPHAHKDIELTILLSGALHIETPEEKFDMGPLDVAYFNPAQPHECQTAVADSCRLLVLQFAPSFCVEYFPAMRNLFFEVNFSFPQNRPFEKSSHRIHHFRLDRKSTRLNSSHMA